jgi:hypothetical protein
MLYDQLTAAGIKVWWDKKCLQPGLAWEKGFLDGLVKSSIFMPILSRGSINDPNNAKSNFSLLTESSMDNVLLELRISLELLERGMLFFIYPIMLGDLDPTTDIYANYFSCGAYPELTNQSNLCVRPVELKTQEHLDRQCLGTPLLENLSVESIVNKILENQGCTVTGHKKNIFDQTLLDAKKMIELRELRKSSPFVPPRERKLSNSTNGESVAIDVNDFDTVRLSRVSNYRPSVRRPSKPGCNVANNSIEMSAVYSIAGTVIREEDSESLVIRKQSSSLGYNTIYGSSNKSNDDNEVVSTLWANINN